MTLDRVPAASGNDQRPGATARLIHVVNGVGVETYDRVFTYLQFPFRGHIDVLVDVTTIEVWVDADDTGAGLAYTNVYPKFTPTSGVSAGRMGAYCYEDGRNTGCNFDEFSVRVKDTDSDTLGDPYDNCPINANLNQLDLDVDGIGDVCDPDQDGDGVTVAGGDCNDRDKTIKPGAIEICDGIDQNCNGLIDDGAPGSTTYFADTDADKYGDPAASTKSCVQPVGYVVDNTDCNDKSAAVHPGAIEICNGIDDDCVGGIDNNATDAKTFYADTDSDTYGNVAAPTKACAQPPGTSVNSTDCDDKNAAVHPGAIEICNGIDDDCVGGIDNNATDAKTFYADTDSDTYGNVAAPTKACAQPPGTSVNSTDCDDKSAAVHPGAIEICNGIDDDCLGGIDNNATDAKTYYADADSDTYGNVAAPTKACAQPPGTSVNSTDCLDTNAAVHPGAIEICNGIDDDCLGGIDNNASDAKTYYADTDGDTYGNPAAPTEGVRSPPGTVIDQHRLPRHQRRVHPGATEICNGIDDNCDGSIDNNAVGAATWYARHRRRRVRQRDRDQGRVHPAGRVRRRQHRLPRHQQGRPPRRHRGLQRDRRRLRQRHRHQRDRREGLVPGQRQRRAREPRGVDDRVRSPVGLRRVVG